jgi:hypothetical protein
VRNKKTKQIITTIDKLVFVNLGDDGKPLAHHKTMDTPPVDSAPYEHNRGRVPPEAFDRLKV